MLRTNNRFARNPLFHFHPMHSLYALITALILLGIMVWFLMGMQ